MSSLPPGFSDPAHCQIMQLSIAANAEQVTDAVITVQRALLAHGVAAGMVGRIELTVAEALNNVVEHGYGARPPGMIHLTVEQGARDIRVCLRDNGQRVPDALLAPRDLPDASGPLHSLPEGGFGWFLIQNLANTLDYRRMAGENHLYLGFYDPDPTEKPT